MGYYRNLRDYLQRLEELGLLVKVSRPIDKDTELHPLVRLQFRGLPAEERKAFYFTHVVDSTGKRYDIPVVVGCMAASRRISAAGMQCAPQEIGDRWVEALKDPIPPVRVEEGPVQEVVWEGRALEAAGGLLMLPIPISTPGFDNAPYTTAAHFVTRDPETGTYNMGNYRGQLKAPDRLGCFAGSRRQHIIAHWEKYRARGEPMPCAAVIGVTPNLSYVAVSKIPAGVDEYSVAGGLAGEPVPLVRCRTIDLEVPAEAEIVIEGYVPTDALEPEGPFGEFTGYMAKNELTLFMNVTAITHRKAPIYQAFISQFPPSESSVLRGVAHEYTLLKYLRVDCGYTNVLDVALYESTGSWGLSVIQVSDPRPGQAFEMFERILARQRDVHYGKVMVVVDDDIDPRDPDSVNWAIAFRMQPARDIKVAPVMEMWLDPSLADPRETWSRGPMRQGEAQASVLFVDATRKWPYPPTSLPSKEYMERAKRIWEELGLPELRLKQPWYGYELGYWPEENAVAARLAVEGRYLETGQLAKEKRVRLGQGE